MKKRIKNLFLVLACMGLLAMPAVAQTFTTLHSFTALVSGTNSDGANPYAGLILSGNTLYGTAYDGGTNGEGTVFAIYNNGTGFTNLHSFTTINNFTNADGANPEAPLTLSGNTLYGTVADGGTNGSGTVFGIHTDGTDFTNLHTFATYDHTPEAGLILSGNTLYGTTIGDFVEGSPLGGEYDGDVGTVFALNTDGTGYSDLLAFTSDGFDPGPGFGPNVWQFPNGGNPFGTLAISGNILYGTLSQAAGTGFYGFGAVFSINTDGSGIATIQNISGGFANNYGPPPSGLILWGNNLYGTAEYDGTNGEGAVFAVNTNGAITNLYYFTKLNHNTNSDGAYPNAGLILSGNTLYGTTLNGGTSGAGTIFSINTDGTGFTNLYSFTGGSDGSSPNPNLVFSNNILYGTTQSGGSGGAGTVFALSFLPQFTCTSNNGTITITEYNGLGGAVSIPDTITGLPVKSIGSGAFAGSVVTSITIPGSVTNIGNSAFQGCTSLTSVTISNGVGTIGDYAFDGCTAMTSIIIPGSITYIGEYALDSVTGVYFMGNAPALGFYWYPPYLPGSGLYPAGTAVGPFGYINNSTRVYYLPGTYGFSPSDSFLPEYSELGVPYFFGNYYLSPDQLVLDNGNPSGPSPVLNGAPAVQEWNPLMQTTGTNFGVQTNQFGFSITSTSYYGDYESYENNYGADTDITVVVEACTNLASPVWLPVATNTLTGGSSYFSDPQWTNYNTRFYRLTLP
jgi:uncharacterized repeat protein (TIGR03803 family)